MKKIRLEMTREQGEAISAALDLAVRIGLGQFEEIASLMTGGIVKATESVSTDNVCDFVRVRDQVLEGLNFAKTTLGHPINGSYGIGSDRLDIRTLRAYEVSKVLDQALHNMRPDADTAFKGPKSDGLVVRYTQDPVPTAVAA